MSHSLNTHSTPLPARLHSLAITPHSTWGLCARAEARDKRRMEEQEMREGIAERVKKCKAQDDSAGKGLKVTDRIRQHRPRHSVRIAHPSTPYTRQQTETPHSTDVLLSSLRL